MHAFEKEVREVQEMVQRRETFPTGVTMSNLVAHLYCLAANSKDIHYISCVRKCLSLCLCDISCFFVVLCLIPI